MHKEQVLKMMTATLDGHTRLRSRNADYCDGIKHVRELLDQTFDRLVHPEELIEFCVSIICSIQPEDPQFNRNLSDLEQGILAAAYFVYTVVQPIEYLAA